MKCIAIILFLFFIISMTFVHCNEMDEFSNTMILDDFNGTYVGHTFGIVMEGTVEIPDNLLLCEGNTTKIECLTEKLVKCYIKINNLEEQLEQKNQMIDFLKENILSMTGSNSKLY